MTSLSGVLKDRLCRTKMVVFPEDYYAVRLPVDSKTVLSEWFHPATTRFAIFFREPREIHLVVARRKWLRMQNVYRKYELTGPLKIICFEPKLSQCVPGYMNAIGKILAENNLSATPISSMRRDHLLVPKGELPRVVKVFRAFLASCKKQTPKKRTK